MRSKTRRVDVLVAMVLAGVAIDPARAAESWPDIAYAATCSIAADEARLGVAADWATALTPIQRKAASATERKPGVAGVMMAVADPVEVSKWKAGDVLRIVALSKLDAALAHTFVAARHNRDRVAWANVAVRSYQTLYERSGRRRGR